MALTLPSVLLDTGLTINTPYIKISNFFGTKESTCLILKYYVNRTASETGKLEIREESYYFKPSVEDDAANIFKQGYEHLKTLPFFANSVDILE